MKRILLLTFTAFMLLGMAMAQDEPGDMAAFRTWAMTPPMGWNSWDCYYSSVTEKEVMQNAQYLVDNDLVRHGWEYVVIDIRHGVKLYRLGDKVADGIKKMEDESIKWDGTMYDLTGCRMLEPAKGLYIQGNKLRMKK